MSFDFLITLFLSGGAFFILIWGVIILWKYTERTLPHKILMVAAALWITFGIWYILAFFLFGESKEKILPLNHLVWGIITGFATMAYPVTVICKEWLRKRILITFFVLTTVVLMAYLLFWAFTGKGFEKYNSYSDIAGHWLDFTIILRLIIYSISAFYNLIVVWLIIRILPVYENYIKNTFSDLEYNLRWLHVAGIFYTGITIVYTFNIFWFNWLTRIIYIIVDFPLWLVLLNQAIFHKSFIPAKGFEIAWSWRNGWHQVYNEKEDESVSMAVDVLIRKMARYMSTPEPYCNNNFTREDFAKALNTNRTTLSQAIKQLGFENFQDYINKHRIEQFKKLAATNPDLSIAGLSKMSGFSSRSTFYSYFKEIEGMLPSKYVESLNKTASGDK